MSANFGFKDADGTITYLSDLPYLLENTIAIRGQDGTYDIRTADRTYLPGSVKLGDRRAEESDIKVSFDFAEEVYTDFLDEINSLIKLANEAEYIVHVDTAASISRQVRVELDSWDIPYDSGNLMLVTRGSFSFTVLDPYWEDTADTTVTQSLSSGTTNVSVNNTGYMTTYPVISLTASAAVSSIEIYVDSTKEGIVVQDSIFGTVGFDEMDIDCLNGTLFVESNDRKQSIDDNTGFFSLPTGSQTLVFILSAAADIEVTFKKRYFI